METVNRNIALFGGIFTNKQSVSKIALCNFKLYSKIYLAKLNESKTLCSFFLKVVNSGIPKFASF